MKKSFSLLELIFVIFLLSLSYIFINIQSPSNSLDIATNKLNLYLKQTRYKALLENMYDDNDSLWHKKRWTLKFFRCRSSIGGIYYSIYSDRNKKGSPNLEESLLDPLSNKYIYSSNTCEYKSNRSKYVLLTKEYGVKNVEVSCNSTNSLGQLSFDTKGQLHSKLSSYDYDEKAFKEDDNCEIIFYSNSNKSKTIIIDAKTGYSYIKK